MASARLHVAPILAAIALGIAAGAATPQLEAVSGLSLQSFYGFLGAVFLNLLKMVVAPMIAATIITGLSALSTRTELSALGLRTLVFYAVTTIAAIIVSLALVNAINPGLTGGVPARELLSLGASQADVAKAVADRANVDIFEFLVNVVPQSVFAAAAQNHILGVVIFSVLFGLALARLEQQYRATLVAFWEAVAKAVTLMTICIMSIAPIGVFGLTAQVIAKSGFAGLGPLLKFALCVVGGLLLYSAVILPLTMGVAARINPFRLYRAIGPALLTAFSTASSSATLPVSIECLTRRAGVSQRVAGFVMPLGVAINHAGTALYECAAALFIAQAYGVILSYSMQLTVVALALLTSVGIAGIPAASLVGVAVILTAIGLPAEAIGVVLVVDRLLDMGRTAVNVLADAACTVIVARLEGERSVLTVPST
jgi:Na+/H+-dicarboxylate symporter